MEPEDHHGDDDNFVAGSQIVVTLWKSHLFQRFFFPLVEEVKTFASVTLA